MHFVENSNGSTNVIETSSVNGFQMLSMDYGTCLISMVIINGKYVKWGYAKEGNRGRDDVW